MADASHSSSSGAFPAAATSRGAAAPAAPSTASKLLADVGAAVSATAIVAPFIAMVDKAIMQNASGQASISTSLRTSASDLMTRPLAFLRRPETLLLWGVYSGTYIAANTIATACDDAEATPAQRHVSKLAGVSGVNLFLNVSKDRIFARMFGTGPPRRVPLPAYALFGMRDSLTVFAAFNVAPVAAAHLEDTLGKGGATTAAQLACPVAMQWISAPLHLGALDLYNRPEAADRAAFVRREYLVTAVARSARIFPAFGVGALLNAPMRVRLHEAFA